MTTHDEYQDRITALQRLVAMLVLAYGEPIGDSGKGYAVDIPPMVLLDSDRWALYELPMTLDQGLRVVVAKDGAYLGRLEPPHLLGDAFMSSGGAVDTSHVGDDVIAVKWPTT